ncbi:MAG: transglycosylase domain-containing protein, partial [Pygmaiobacter sp.]
MKQHPYRDEEHPYSAEDDIFTLLDSEDETEESDIHAVPPSASHRSKKPTREKVHKPPKTKKAKRHRSFKARILSFLFALLLLCTAVLGVYLVAATRNDELWLDLDQIPYKTETILYAKSEDSEDWEEYSRLRCTQNKRYVPAEEIPKQLGEAFIAVEDQSFYRHSGVNLPRTVLAMVNEAVHALTGRYPSGVKMGASTIDQQLIKNLTWDDDANGLSGYLRKAKEIYRAYKLDAKYDKDEILTAYLNTISFTDNTAGVEAAAQKIFGCPANDLTLPQCASLAAITRSPARYDPEKNPDKHTERRNYVLGAMLKEHFITQEEHDAAVATPLETTGAADPKRDAAPTDWFTDLVMEQVTGDLAAEYHIPRSEATQLLYNGGLRIYTTVVPCLQEAMSDTLKSASVYPRPKETVIKALTAEDGTPILDDGGDPVLGEVTVRPEAGMVSLNYSGEICAVAGALGEKTTSRSYDRATMAVRQVGSTMKPIG